MSENIQKVHKTEHQMEITAAWIKEKTDALSCLNFILF